MTRSPLSRRRVIKAAGALTGSALITGCSGNTSDRTSTQKHTTSPTRTPTDTTTRTEETTEETTRRNSNFVRPRSIDKPSPQGWNITPPESELDLKSPDWIVAKDGSGDYDSIQDAMQIAKEGDIIGLSSNKYSIEGTDEIRKYLFVGNGVDATTLEIIPSQDSYRSGYKLLPGAVGALTLTGPPNEYDPQDVFVTDGGSVVGSHIQGGIAKSKDNTKINISKSRIEGTVEVPRVNIDTTIIKGTFVGGGDLRKTRVMGGGTIKSGTLSKIIMDQTLTSADQTNNIHISNSILHGYHVASQLDNHDTMIEQSILEPSPDTNLAIQADGGKIEVIGCIIRGKCETEAESALGNPKVPNLETVAGSIFESDGRVDWYFDGWGPNLLYGSVFKDGDIRIDGNRTSVFSEDKGIGNYYSEFDRDDEDGDGIIDYPRPIPGEAEKVDRHPLSKAQPALNR